MNRAGDRFGGVVFDIQQYRKGEQVGTLARMRLIAAASLLIEAIEKGDEEELQRCDDTSHDRWGQRRSDCRECTGTIATMADVADIIAKRERAQGVKSTDSTWTPRDEGERLHGPKCDTCKCYKSAPGGCLCDRTRSQYHVPDCKCVFAGHASEADPRCMAKAKAKLFP